MKTLNLTDAEFEVLVQAVAMINDFENDTLFENVSENLFPGTDSPTVLTNEKAKVLREDLVGVVERTVARRALCAKVGVNVNDQGYTA